MKGRNFLKPVDKFQFKKEIESYKNKERNDGLFERRSQLIRDEVKRFL